MNNQNNQSTSTDTLLQANEAIGKLLSLQLPEYMHKPLLALVKGLQTMHQTMSPFAPGSNQSQPNQSASPNMMNRLQTLPPSMLPKGPQPPMQM